MSQAFCCKTGKGLQEINFRILKKKPALILLFSIITGNFKKIYKTMPEKSYGQKRG